MRADDMGFAYPEIDPQKCVGCGLCGRACPALNKTAENKSGDTFQYRHPDCGGSASGGAFYGLARAVLDAGGAVAGTVWGKDFNPETIIGDSIEQIEKMRGSKYVAGDTKDTYRAAKKLLESGRPVLYSGTPCQIAGLRGFLGKDYDNLITADLVCYGPNSPAVWQRALGEMTGGRPLKNVFLSCGKQKAVFEYDDGSVESDEFYKNLFMRIFLQNTSHRPRCQKCPFATRARVGDITIGDIHASPVKADGISLVMCNTEKGLRLFEKADFAIREPFDIDDKSNQPINFVVGGATHAGISESAAGFAKHFQSGASLSEWFGKKRVGILNYNMPWVNDVKYVNYGSSLLDYALERVIAKLGYDAATINNYNTFWGGGDTDVSPKSRVWQFREKYLNLLGFVAGKSDLQAHILPKLDTVVIGSEQLWAETRNYVFWGDWVCGKKGLISYAVSFGDGKMPDPDEKKVKCLRRFDSLSVREKSAVGIVKDYAGLDAELALDPALLIDAEEYQQIIDGDAPPAPPARYAAFYFIYPQPLTDLYKNDSLPFIKSEMDLVNASKDDFGPRSFGDWLNIMKNAELVITDSFHGVCFAILYRRRFVYIRRASFNEKVFDLLDRLGLGRGMTADSIYAITREMTEADIDFDAARATLNELRGRSIEWLKIALAKEPAWKAGLEGNPPVRKKTRGFFRKLFRMIRGR
jgi:coenzyme F420-reducing hydrogenase beta subunit